jgi:CubicO group peptidase (beta-lactamase class C family)
MRFRWVSTAVALVGLAGVAGAQTPEQLAALEKDIEAARARIGVPGVSVAVVKDGKVVFSKGFGLRDVEKKQPVTPDTLFAIGSSTKAFTAAALLMAVDAKKVGLDEPPKKYLPYFKMRDSETDAKITVRDLLRHTSGLTRTDFMMLAADGKLNRVEMIQAACSALPTAKLGEKWQYQNIMFSAAGEIAVGAFGQPYEKLIETRIFKPLGMSRANLTIKQALADPDHASGYNLDPATKKATFIPMRSLGSTPGAGAINASASEMTRWLRLWLDDGTVGGKRLLSSESIAEATKQQTASPLGGYGFGWFLSKWEGIPVVEHGGNIDGFNANVAFIPGQKIGVVVLTNVFSSPLADEATKLVWKHLATKPEAPTGPAAVATEPEKEVGSYFKAGAPVTIEVRFKEGGKLSLQPTGQPELPLIPLGGRKYRIGSPAPDGFFASFSTVDGKNDVEVIQPGVQVVFTRGVAIVPPPFEAGIAVEELLKRVVGAAGGSEELARIQTLKLSMTVDFENQGMTGRGESLARAPLSHASRIELTAAGKKVGWVGDWFDGEKGGQAGSFMPMALLEGENLKRAKIGGRFFDGLLQLQDDYEKIEIVGKGKIGEVKHGIPETECWVVNLKAKGLPDRATFFITTDSYRIVRRDATIFAQTGAVPTRTYYGDFRRVGKVTLPYLTVTDTPTSGFIVQRTEKAEVDAPIDPAAFAGPKKK